MRVFTLRGIDGLVVLAMAVIVAIVVGVQAGNLLSDSGVSVQSGVSAPFSTTGDTATIDTGTVIDQALADQPVSAGGAATADRVYLQAAAAASTDAVSSAPTSQLQAIDQALADHAAAVAAIDAGTVSSVSTAQWQAIEQALADQPLAAGGAATADRVYLQAAAALATDEISSTVPESWLGMYRAYSAANAPAIATDVPESWLGMYRAYTVAQEAAFAGEAVDWSAYRVELSPQAEAVEGIRVQPNVFHE